ncbi:hypothetical protein POM88_000556 [Heracleum sosnowskyi]|uniref:Mind bomb SH3 repeat domain-containing protein n=1 Tax=Heracleum sosnowskyi TaxID=360622 RepID=A0AAD8N9V5_9APIA|nr:hypothetical protein POM88_000556 [Heracleum sosnowskyi]
MSLARPENLKQKFTHLHVFSTDVLYVDDDGILHVGFHGSSRGWKLDPAEMFKTARRHSSWGVSPGDAERLSGYEVGDSVLIKPSLDPIRNYDWNSIGKESLEVVHSVPDNGYLELACCFRKGKWITHYMDVNTKRHGNGERRKDYSKQQPG